MLCRSGSRRVTSWACTASSNTFPALRRLAVLRPLSSSSSSTAPNFISVDGQRRSLSSSSTTPKPTSQHGSTISLDSQRRILQRCDELQSYLQVGRKEGKGLSFIYILPKRTLLPFRNSPLLSSLHSLPPSLPAHQ